MDDFEDEDDWEVDVDDWDDEEDYPWEGHIIDVFWLVASRFPSLCRWELFVDGVLTSDAGCVIICLGKNEIGMCLCTWFLKPCGGLRFWNV